MRSWLSRASDEEMKDWRKAMRIMVAPGALAVFFVGGFLALLIVVLITLVF